MNYDLIIFVEDPGAANFIIDLYRDLKSTNLKFIVVADGTGKQILINFNVNYLDLSSRAKKIIYSNNSAGAFLVGTSERIESEGLKIIEHCRKNNISSISFVDMNINIESRYKGGSDFPLKYAPDYLFVIDKSAKSKFIDLGFHKNRIVVVNHPVVNRLHTFVRPITKNEINSIKKIVFIDEGIDRLNESNTTKNNQYLFHGTTNSINRTKIIFEELLDALRSIDFDYKLIVRLHPSNKRSFYSKYYTHINRFSKKTKPYILLANADVVVGMTSMLLYEASFINDNHFSIIAQRNEKYWLPSIIEKRTEVATNKSDILKLLNRFLSNKIKSNHPNNLVSKQKDFSSCLIKLLHNNES